MGVLVRGWFQAHFIRQYLQPLSSEIDLGSYTEFMSVYKDRNSGNWVKQRLSSYQALAGIHETKHVSKTEGHNPFDKLVTRKYLRYNS